jgi:predicted DNA-binding transcriptional regulator AlpA
MAGERITPKQLRERFGNISEMTLWRWARDEAFELPKPLIINRRKYYSLTEIEEWERRRSTSQASKAQNVLGGPIRQAASANKLANSP